MSFALPTAISPQQTGTEAQQPLGILAEEGVAVPGQPAFAQVSTGLLQPHDSQVAGVSPTAMPVAETTATADEVDAAVFKELDSLNGSVADVPVDL